MFFRDIAHFSEKCMDIAPFQIVRYRVLEDSVESALMGAGEWSGCFHIVLAKLEMKRTESFHAS